jgi:hypothetical protein
MRYFIGDQAELHDAKSEVWARQRKAGRATKAFSESLKGKVKNRPTCMWTADPESEKLFRTVLQEMNITFEESDERVDPHKKKWRF